MAISDVLLEGRLTFKTYLDKGGGGVKILRFSLGKLFMDGPQYYIYSWHYNFLNEIAVTSVGPYFGTRPGT